MNDLSINYRFICNTNRWSLATSSVHWKKKQLELLFWVLPCICPCLKHTGFFNSKATSCCFLEQSWNKGGGTVWNEMCSLQWGPVFFLFKLHGFKCAWGLKFILCSATYIKPAADPETRGCKGANKTWPFLQSAAVGLITLHTWEETSGSCEGREFKWSDHRLTDNTGGCFFCSSPSACSDSVYSSTLPSTAQTMARRFSVSRHQRVKSDRPGHQQRSRWL